MKTKELKQLQNLLTKELKQPLTLPPNFKQLLINRYGSVCNAASFAGISYGTLYKMIRESSYISKHKAVVAYLLTNDPKSSPY